MQGCGAGAGGSGPGVAGLTDWTVAFALLLPAFAVPVAAALRGGVADRLAAVPLAGSVAMILLALAMFVFDQSSFIDIALCLALLTLPGTLVLALFLECGGCDGGDRRAARLAGGGDVAGLPWLRPAAQPAGPAALRRVRQRGGRDRAGRRRLCGGRAVGPGVQGAADRDRDPLCGRGAVPRRRLRPAVPRGEDRSPTDEEREKDDRPLWLMLLPAVALLAGSCVDADGAGRIASSAAAALMLPGTADGPASLQPAIPVTLLAWLSVGLALLLAACQLSWRHLPAWLATGAQRVLDLLSAGLRFLHDGAVGDYTAWVVVGLALLTAAFGLS